MKTARAHDRRLRVARESDDRPLLSLDATARASSTRAVYRPRTFFGRAHLYERARTIVATGPDGEIVGAVCGAVKRVTLNGSPTTAGHVFNLRVAPGARRAGVGRTLVAAVEVWLEDEGATATFCLVDERNGPSLCLFERAGYGPVARAAYLEVWRASLEPGDDGRGGRRVDLVDVSRSVPWQDRIRRAYAGRDFCPVDLVAELYAPRAEGGYVGTLWSPAGSWLSIWDKDRAARRDAVHVRDRGVFLYDLSLRNAAAFAGLVRALFTKFAWVERAVCFIPGEMVGPFELDRIAILDRHELVMLRSPSASTRTRETYLDVRD